MRQVVLYGSPECHLCAAAKVKLQRVRRCIPFDLSEMDVRHHPELLERYGARIPVVSIDGQDVLVSKVTEFWLLKALAFPGGSSNVYGAARAAP